MSISQEQKVQIMITLINSYNTASGAAINNVNKICEAFDTIVNTITK